MAVRLGPPLFPWIARRSQAFNPTLALYLPDEGPVRDAVGGRHAVRSGSTRLGRGEYGPCLNCTGGTALTPTLPGTYSECTITVAHKANGTGNMSPLGIGASGQTGLLYYNGQFGINGFSGVLLNPISLATPSASWRVISVTFKGFTTNSPIAYWVDGVLAYSGSLGTNLVNPGGSTIRLGATGNGSWPWSGGIGPALVHDRVLSRREIELTHGDPWAIYRDTRSVASRIFPMLPPPPFPWSGDGTSGIPEGSGEFDWAWPWSGDGSVVPEGSGEFTWNWQWSGDGSVTPEGSGEFAWVPPFIPTHLRSNARPVGPSARNVVVRRK